jgi:hypothetical protein
MAKAVGLRPWWGLLACVVAGLPLALAGCSGPKVTPEIIFTAPPAVDTAGIGETPTIDTIAITSSAPDNTWTVTFKKPILGGGVSDAALTKMNDAITAKVNGYIHAFSGGSLPAVASGGSPSTLEGDFSVAMISSSIVSLRFTILTDISGSGKLTEEPASISLWVPTGATIDLSELFNDQKAAVSALASKAHAGLSKALGKTLTWDGKATDISFFDAWDITPTGLEFTWAQDKIADQSAGLPAVTLAWSDIKSIVRGDGPAGQFEH